MLVQFRRPAAISAIVALTLAAASAIAERRVNSEPSISGTPATEVDPGTAYRFVPTADDPDGDKMRFRIAGKPAWAEFNSTTGVLSGTPGTPDVGTYSSITITVTDGRAATSLPSFDLTVNPSAGSGQAPTGSAVIRWTAPTENMDGSTLTNLAGFRVLYGSRSGVYDRTLDLPNAAMTSVMIEGLAAGTTWYFTVKAVNSAGIESDYSSAVSKTL